MHTRETCELVFSTSLEGERTIRIPDPRLNLNAAHVNAAVSHIISANLFDETVGQLTELVRAVKVTVDRHVLI